MARTAGPSRTRRTARRLALAMVALVAGGCATAARTQQADAVSTAAAPPPAEAPPRDARAAFMAEQARRDVDDLERLSAEAPPSPPEVRWIVLPGLAGADAAAADSAAAGDAAPAPAGSPTPPPAARSAAVQESLAVASAVTAPGAGIGAGLPESPGRIDEDRLRRLVADLSRELSLQAAWGDVPLRPLLLVAATALLDGECAVDPAAQPGLSDRERDVLTKVQAFCARVGAALGETDDPEAVVTAVAELHKALAAEPELRIARTALCTRVGGFGDFDELRRNASGHYVFLAHSGQQAVVYVEVEDFTSRLDDKGQWVTELAQQLTIYSDRDGIPVWGGGEWQVGVDRSRNRREDFFVVQVITLDERLSVGRYQLKVRIRDERSGAEAETSVDLEMVADPALAGG